jgi:hypothetical protein
MAYLFAAPIPPGKTDAVRRFIAETLGPRKAEYDDLQRRSGVTEEAYWLQVDPAADDAIAKQPRRTLRAGKEDAVWVEGARSQRESRAP